MRLLAESARPDPEADIPAIKLVGYWTSHKEIRDLYHSVYLLRRSSSPPPCGTQWRERQSKTSCPLWGAVCIGRDTLPPPRKMHEGLLWLLPIQYVHGNPGLGLGGGKTHMIQPSESTEGCPHVGMWHWEAKLGVDSSSHPQSQSLDKCLRSPSRHRLERRVTFWEPEVEPDPSERPYRGPQGCSLGIPLDSNGFPHLPKGRRHYIAWSCQYPTQTLAVGGLPAWAFYREHWSMAGLAGLPVGHAALVVELTATSSMENPRRLAHKMCASFLIPVVRCEASPGQEYTVPPALKCISRNMFSPQWSILSGCSTAVIFQNPLDGSSSAWTHLREKGNYWCHHGGTGRERCRVRMPLQPPERRRRQWPPLGGMSTMSVNDHIKNCKNHRHII